MSLGLNDAPYVTLSVSNSAARLGSLKDSAVAANFDDGICVTLFWRVSLPPTLPLGFSFIVSSSPNAGALLLMGLLEDGSRTCSFSEAKVWLGFDLYVSGLASENALRFLTRRD